MGTDEYMRAFGSDDGPVGEAARRFGLKDRYGKVRTYSIGGRKRGFSDDEEADFGARLDESFCPGAVSGDAEPADTGLRYVEVPKAEGVDDEGESGSSAGLAEEIAEVVRDGAKMSRRRLSDKTGMEINIAVRVLADVIVVMVVKGHGVVEPLVYRCYKIGRGDEKVKCAEKILEGVEGRFLSEHRRWKRFFNV